MCTLKISDTRDKIFSAMSKMQAELTNASKSKSGHGYRYADLAECIETAKEPLANNGLAVTQMLGMSANNEATLITMLTHESGEYIASEFIMEKAVLGGGAGKNPAQAMGASITYMRRYAFSAIIGLAQDDDDNASNTQNKPTAPTANKSLQNSIETMKNTLVNELGSMGQALLYISTAIGKDTPTFDNLTAQDINLIRAYYKANKPQPTEQKDF